MIAVELRKLMLRPRTWVSIALLVLLPAVVAVFLKVSPIAPRPGTGPAFLSAVLSNGALFPAAALAIVLPLFLPVAVAVVGGESVAGEAAAGTLRYLLVRPVRRTRLLVAKLVALVAYVLLAVLLVAGVSYLVGVALFGSAPLPSTSGTTLSAGGATLRLVLAVLYVAWSMVGVGALALLFSTVTDSALAAALGAVAVLVLSGVLVGLDAAGAVRPYLPTRYWLSFIDLFRDPVLYRDVVKGALLQLGYVVGSLALAWANFMTKDITS